MAHHPHTGLRAASVLLGLTTCLLGAAPRALALATEHFGNDPVAPGFIGVGPDVLALANLKTRFYWFEVNGDPTFYYRGKAEDLNEALQKFAVLGGTPELILLPGPGEGSSLTGEQRFSFDWWVHTPAGLTLGGPPTLTLYVSATAHDKPPDTEQLRRWITDLDSDTFATRDRASRELEKLGYAAAPALREALAARPSAEARRAIERLQSRLRGVDLREVRLPKGVTVLEVKDLLERCRGRLRSAEGSTRGYAASALGGLAPYADVVPDLVAVLRDDKHEFARRSAAGALSRLAGKAVPALPLLKAGLNDPDVNVRNAFAYAVKQIEGGEEKPDEGRLKRQRALLEGIRAFREALPADAKK